jgi:hypothetical protein
MPERKSLAFGLRAIPEGVAPAWGARLIWPDDLLHDRTSWLDGEHDVDLMTWLNGGALRSALTEARRMADSYELRPSEDREVTLFEDETGVVKANPQCSHGYLYVAAWLKQ